MPDNHYTLLILLPGQTDSQETTFNYNTRKPYIFIFLLIWTANARQPLYTFNTFNNLWINLFNLSFWTANDTPADTIRFEFIYLICLFGRQMTDRQKKYYWINLLFQFKNNIFVQTGLRLNFNLVQLDSIIPLDNNK